MKMRLYASADAIKLPSSIDFYFAYIDVIFITNNSIKLHFLSTSFEVEMKNKKKLKAENSAHKTGICVSIQIW